MGGRVLKKRSRLLYGSSTLNGLVYATSVIPLNVWLGGLEQIYRRLVSWMPS